jgi:hypothetical protein
LLVGGFDECTANSYAIMKRMGLWKIFPVNSMQILDYQNKGSLPGEGVAFFAITGMPEDLCRSRIAALETFYNPENSGEAGDRIVEFLKASGLKPVDIDLAVVGMNGDRTGDRFYIDTLQHGGLKCGYAVFKHLCGEYDTASSFGLWLASEIIHAGKVPSTVFRAGPTPGKIRNVLLYNHLRGMNHALYLLQSC